MASLYLGRISSAMHSYEVHAFTQYYGFRGYRPTEISDAKLYLKLIKTRYQLMEMGSCIYCTAVNPNKIKKIECNPHDSREGTVHIVALNEDGVIQSGISVSVDTGEMAQGSPIGLPLENKWEYNGFPAGSDLDPFREKYSSLNNDKPVVQPWKMAELYRHFNRISKDSSLISRLGLYAGCYHLLVREARNRAEMPTTLWVFDAILQYYELYRFAGIAVLRDMTIGKRPIFVSPSKQQIEKKCVAGKTDLYYNQKKISRQIIVPRPIRKNGVLHFKNQSTPFIDGLVDLDIVERFIRKDPYFLFLKNIQGFSLKDRLKLRAGMALLAKRAYEKDFHQWNFPVRCTNKLMCRNVKTWHFNHVGL
ncbi:hypothetical protein KAR48_11225 [bacterium]|nr:hypothetical protein [bacterium]